MNGFARASDHGDVDRERAEEAWEAEQEERSWPPETDEPEEDPSGWDEASFNAEFANSSHMPRWVVSSRPLTPSLSGSMPPSQTRPRRKRSKRRE
jgi:hypothetical protein